MPILEKDDVVLDYLETGQGTTVILIHSTVSGNRQWKTLMEDLGRDFRVLAPNLRGYGKTSSWLEPNPFYLLRQNQRMEGYREALELRDQIRKHGSKNNWTQAADFFCKLLDRSRCSGEHVRKAKTYFHRGLKTEPVRMGDA